MRQDSLGYSYVDEIDASLKWILSFLFLTLSRDPLPTISFSPRKTRVGDRSDGEPESQTLSASVSGSSGRMTADRPNGDVMATCGFTFLPRKSKTIELDLLLLLLRPLPITIVGFCSCRSSSAFRTRVEDTRNGSASAVLAAAGTTAASAVDPVTMHDGEQDADSLLLLFLPSVMMHAVCGELISGKIWDPDSGATTTAAAAALLLADEDSVDVTRVRPASTSSCVTTGRSAVLQMLVFGTDRNGRGMGSGGAAVAGLLVAVLVGWSLGATLLPDDEDND